MSLQINNLTGFGGGDSFGPVEITRTDTAVDTSSQTTYTFSAQSFGAAFARRKILVAATAVRSGTVVSATIGGVSATIAYQVTAVGRILVFLIATVPGGTTGDVVITYDGEATVSSIVVWALKNIKNNLATDTDTDNDSSSLAGTINCNSGGVIVGIGMGSSNPSAFTWGGIDEDLARIQAEGTTYYGSGFKTFLTAQSALAVTLAMSSAAAEIVAWAAFR